MSSPVWYESVNISNNSLCRIRTTGHFDSRSFVTIFSTMPLDAASAHKCLQTRVISAKMVSHAADREPI